MILVLSLKDRKSPVEATSEDCPVKFWDVGAEYMYGADQLYHVDKVQNQEADCRKYALSKGYDVTAVYCDDGISASSFKERPGYLQMLSDAQVGKFDVLIAVAVDRFSRQPQEKLMLAAAIVEPGIVAQWEPIVSREDFEAVQAIINDPLIKRYKGSREPRWLLAGVARCGVCGEKMVSGGGSDRHKRFTVYFCSVKRHPGQDKGRRHASIKSVELDALIVAKVVSAFLFAPTQVNASPELVAIGELHARLNEIRQALADLVELVGSPGFKVAMVQKRAAELATEEAGIVAKLEDLRRQNAHAAMLLEARKSLFTGPVVSIEDASKLKVALKARFESLPLEQQRTLVKSLLVVTVNSFVRGKHVNSVDRVEVETI